MPVVTAVGIVVFSMGLIVFLLAGNALPPVIMPIGFLMMVTGALVALLRGMYVHPGRFN